LSGECLAGSNARSQIGAERPSLAAVIHRLFGLQGPSFLPNRAIAYFVGSFARFFITLPYIFPVKTSI
jgi:hypothetical protein